VRNKLVGYSQGSTSASYVYDDDGDRVSETVGGVTTVYLTDTQNPTDYDQPIEATAGSTRTTYILGDRILGQADTSGNISYLLVDGHGSTRALTNSSGNITQTFNYDAFGTALNFNPGSAGTVFLFGGDAIYDPTSGLYFHGDGVRATNGFLFIQTDTSGGTPADPLTLHKYLYAVANPISNSDPSGRFTILDELLTASLDSDLEGSEAGLGEGAEAEAEGDVDAVSKLEETEEDLEDAGGYWNVYLAGNWSSGLPHFKIDVLSQDDDAGIAYDVITNKAPSLFGIGTAYLRIRSTTLTKEEEGGYKMWNFATFDNAQNALFGTAAAGIAIGPNANKYVKLTLPYAVVPYPFTINCTVWAAAATATAWGISKLPI
jgi:hypothetical protein